MESFQSFIDRRGSELEAEFSFLSPSDVTTLLVREWKALKVPKNISTPPGFISNTPITSSIGSTTNQNIMMNHKPNAPSIIPLHTNMNQWNNGLNSIETMNDFIPVNQPIHPFYEDEHDDIQENAYLASSKFSTSINNNNIHSYYNNTASPSTVSSIPLNNNLHQSENMEESTLSTDIAKSLHQFIIINHLPEISNLNGNTNIKIIRLDRQLSHFYLTHPTAKEIIQNNGGISSFCAKYGKLFIYFQHYFYESTVTDISVIGTLKDDIIDEIIIPIQYDTSSLLNQDVLQLMSQYIITNYPSTYEIRIEQLGSMYMANPTLKDKLKTLGGLLMFMSFNSQSFRFIEYIKYNKHYSSIRFLKPPNQNTEWPSSSNQLSTTEAIYTVPLNISSLTSEQIREATRLASEISYKHNKESNSETSKNEKESLLSLSPEDNILFQKECQITAQKIISFVSKDCLDGTMILPQDMIRLYDTHPEIKPILSKAGKLKKFCEIYCSKSLDIIQDDNGMFRELKLINIGGEWIKKPIKVSPKIIATKLHAYILLNGQKKTLWEFQLTGFYSMIPEAKSIIKDAGGISTFCSSYLHLLRTHLTGTQYLIRAVNPA